MGTMTRRLGGLLAVALIGITACFDLGSEETDSLPPSVVIDLPAAGAVVSGGVDILVTSFDDNEVRVVRFFIDGTLLFEDTQRPFSATWDSSTVADGPHTIRVESEDLAGNVSTASITVTVQNTTN